MNTFVVDTNVAVAANGRNTHASDECQLICIETLEKIIKSDSIAIDDEGLIMSEYQKYLHPKGEPGVGDAFYRYIFDHQYSSKKIERVTITPIDDHGNFDEFPNNDRDLNGFDLSDRKFVAVALTSSNNAEIVNATDSDWVKYARPLSRYVKVVQLCPGRIYSPENGPG